MREIPREALIKKIKLLNPHWDSKSIDPDIKAYGKRGYFTLFYPLVKQSSVNRAVVLMGPRRAGKTVMLQQTIQTLIDEGTEPTRILYLSIDTPLLQGLSLDALLELYLEAGGYKSYEGCYVIFDEIQYLDKWDVHLKSLVDLHKKTKFIVSGSAAAALQRKSVESGAGRFTDFLLPPLTFHEYLKLLKLDSLLMDRTSGKLRAKNISALNTEFIKYLNFGGYPEAIFNKEIQQSPDRFIRSDIIEKVLLRNLPSLYGIQDIQELTRLFNALAYQTGNEVSLEGLSKSSGVAKNTIKRYIEYLEAAFLIRTVQRIDFSGKTFKRANYFKVYLTNPSMYAAMFEPIKADGNEIGNLVETAMFSQFMHDSRTFDRIVYARSKGGESEVDLILLDDSLKPKGCIEVKWSDQYFEEPYSLKGLRSFCSQSDIEFATCTTRTEHGEKEINDTLTISFVPVAIACFSIGENILLHKHFTSLVSTEQKMIGK